MKKILVVDDSAFMRGILKDLLAQHPATPEIYEAEDKKTALQQAKKVMPDLVLLDIVMQKSELEGVEILKELRKAYPTINVIMLTSVGQTGVIEECKKLGARYYIEKPFDPDNVRECVSKYIT